MPKPGKSALLLLVLLFTVPSFADSHARIVRLSDVQGNVQVDRNVGQGYEKAFVNLPITEGVKLRTEADGRAEVEFEDGGILHLTPGTMAEFPVLSLRQSGAKVSTVTLGEGTAYLSFAGRNGDEFILGFGPERVSFTQSAHVRVQMLGGKATLAVLDGEVQVAAANGNFALAKKHAATFDLSQGTYTLAKVSGEPFDNWDKEQVQYHDRYLSKNSYNPSPYSYGVSDLNYYGNFINAGGMGSCWQPYFTGANWNPFMNGSWVWYPTGYTWVSAYPWGWMPYNYGSWNYISSGGWCWFPGNSWGVRNTLPVIAGGPRQFMPLRPPVTPQHSRIVVNRGPVAMTQGGFSNRTIIRQGSAGMGVARGSINNLNRLSQRVDQRGSVTTSMRPPVNSMPGQAGASAGSPAWRGNSAGQQAGSAASSRANSSSRMQSSPAPMPRMGGQSMSRGSGPGPTGPRR